MHTEIELISYFKTHSTNNILESTYDAFLSKVNTGVIPMTNAYLYEKLFLEKEKGINYVHKLGFKFKDTVDNGEEKNKTNSQNNEINEPYDRSTEGNNIEIDFFPSLENTEEFLELKEKDLTDFENDYVNNDVYFNRLYNEDGKEDKTIEKIVEANQKLVTKIASNYENVVKNSILDLDDLIASGNRGLYKAIEKFDPELGYKFSTYATYWIRQKITRDIADYKLTIRLPVHLHEKINQVHKVIKESMSENLTEQINFCMERLNMSEKALLDLFLIDKQFNNGVTSLQTLVGEDNDTVLENFVDAKQVLYGSNVKSPNEELLANSFRKEVEKIMHTTLNDREREILEKRMGWHNGDPKTLEEIGTEKGVTRERIRQIESKSLKKLKGQFVKYRLDEYMEEYK
ncbi:sigma-70 family RNA polymerase sigma factor [Salinicoccus roseus]|uniref:sigma-70 family RNA polymerase sigma factor n=1 Tax=Salinicoccus roseus TaxID=45670 RepID=UPI0023010934|nr:sigma-70 family RNA polymerase sigma factor [Salinicoccus roseus]